MSKSYKIRMFERFMANPKSVSCFKGQEKGVSKIASHLRNGNLPTISADLIDKTIYKKMVEDIGFLTPSKLPLIDLDFDFFWVECLAERQEVPDLPASWGCYLRRFEANNAPDEVKECIESLGCSGAVVGQVCFQVKTGRSDENNRVITFDPFMIVQGIEKDGTPVGDYMLGTLVDTADIPSDILDTISHLGISSARCVSIAIIAAMMSRSSRYVDIVKPPKKFAESMAKSGRAYLRPHLSVVDVSDLDILCGKPVLA